MSSGDQDPEREKDENQGQGQPRRQSGPSRVRSFVRFVNRTEHRVDVIWLNHEGFGVRYRTLGPRQAVDVNTFVGHPWIFRDSDTGESLCAQLREVYEPVGNPDEGTSRRRQVYITNQLYSLRTRCLQEVRRLIPDNRLHLLELPRELHNDLIATRRQRNLDRLVLYGDNRPTRAVTSPSNDVVNQSAPITAEATSSNDCSLVNGEVNCSDRVNPSADSSDRLNSVVSASRSDNINASADSSGNNSLHSQFNPLRSTGRERVNRFNPESSLTSLFGMANNNNNDLAVDRNCNNNNNANAVNQNRVVGQAAAAAGGHGINALGGRQVAAVSSVTSSASAVSSTTGPPQQQQGPVVDLSQPGCSYSRDALRSGENRRAVGSASCTITSSDQSASSSSNGVLHVSSFMAESSPVGSTTGVESPDGNISSAGDLPSESGIDSSTADDGLNSGTNGLAENVMQNGATSSTSEASSSMESPQSVCTNHSSQQSQPAKDDKLVLPFKKRRQ